MLTRRRALGLLGLATAAGCSVSGPARSPLTRPTPGVGLEQVAQVLHGALARGDRSGFVGAFEASLRTQAAVLFDNAGRLGSFVVDADPVRPALRVRWRVGDERDPSTAVFGARVSDAGRVLALDEPTGGAPSWWRHPVVVRGAGPAWLVAAEARAEASEPWLEAAVAALAHLRAARLEPWASAWDATMVLEVPFDLLGFASGASTAAYVAFPSSTDGGRIVVNPTLLTHGDAAGRVGLLVHEGVHVLTRGGFLDAPLWVAEGLAEHVAAQVWSDAAADNARRIRELLDAAPPTDLPTPEELRGEDRLTAYALAAVAVEACLERWGREEALTWMAAWAGPGRPSADEIRGVYLARLGRLARR